MKGGIASSAPNGRYGSHHVVRNEKRSILDLEFQLMRGGIAVRYLDEGG
ncbi:MAG: hypothetical protein QXO92_04585 [Candidatus Bathyarchaeia archaeon]